MRRPDFVSNDTGRSRLLYTVENSLGPSFPGIVPGAAAKVMKLRETSTSLMKLPKLTTKHLLLACPQLVPMFVHSRQTQPCQTCCADQTHQYGLKHTNAFAGGDQSGDGWEDTAANLPDDKDDSQC